jgi:predicted metal-dependent hydrolase
VDAPSDANMASIKEAVRKRSRWVLNHLKSIRKRTEHVLPRQYVSGESHFYLGRRYLLKLIDALPENGKPMVKLERGKLAVFAKQPAPEDTRRLLNDWYRSRAEKVFEKRLRLMCDKLAWIDQVPDWHLLAMTKQWGSCSPSGKLSLNPRLVKAPTECVDYVLLHELCHLQAHNHSPRFYERLECAMPHWRRLKGKLDAMAEMILNE